MCGIVGYIGSKRCLDFVFEGLQKLEYRGYDSAGIAVLHEGKIAISKESGKLENLKPSLQQLPEQAQIGIGHTRWATHGLPTRGNAHPHVSDRLALIHNGIIENYKELKQELQKKGVVFSSETDTEVVAHLIGQELKTSSSPREALNRAIARLEGAFSLALLSDQDEDHIYLAKQGSPLVIGLGQGENFFGSDVTAFCSHTQKAVFLHDGECAAISRSGINIWNRAGDEVHPKTTLIQWTPGSAEKQGYRHYMLKEIHEQPGVISKTIHSFIRDQRLDHSALGLSEIDIKKVKSIHLVACGTAHYAAMVAKYLMEPALGIPVNVELASEFRYRDPLLLSSGQTLVIAVSQSGETADTLACLKHARAKGCQIFSICNVAYSSIHRESHASILMQAGPEIGVASTKAFTSQVLCAYLWTLAAAEQLNRLDRSQWEAILQELKSLPLYMDQALNVEEQVAELANQLYEHPNFIYLGRGPSFVIALEGALKLKEISYIHAEGYAAGELKHGPIALVDRHMPLVAVVPRDHYYEKTVSNIEEVRAREGQVIAIGDEKDEHLRELCNHVLHCPSLKNPCFQAILSTVAVQFLAYYIAVKRGTDVDQPRNLAKSVTVE